jgi:hypothetical protein
LDRRPGRQPAAKRTLHGSLIYNRTSQKLKTPTRQNPPEEWIRTPHAFEGIISPEQFEQAQELLLQRRKKYDPEQMLGLERGSTGNGFTQKSRAELRLAERSALWDAKPEIEISESDS